MALSITEANHVNKLLDYLLGYDEYGQGLPSAEQAREAAVALADKANKALMAGVNGPTVRSLWTEEAPRPVRPARKGRRP